MKNNILPKFRCCHNCGRKLIFCEDNKGNRFKLSDEDKYLLEKYWRVDAPKPDRYVVRNKRVDGKQKKIYLHREIMKTPPHLVVDHKDGDGLNNCRCNLENITDAENKHSSRRHR